MDFNRCYKCFKPMKACRCADITPVDTGVRFIFLMHPKEAYKQKTGTGRLTSLSLADSEIIVGIDFTNNARVNELISGANGAEGYGEGKDAFPVILYPASDAYFTDSPEFRTAIGHKKLIVIVVDATWFFARKMINLSVNLHGIPKLSFRKEYRSRFEFKKQPSPECLSTIESTYYLAQELKEAGIVKPEADLSCLMTAFRNMVEYQLACEQARHVAMARELYPELFEGQA
ncbi:MAG TPA: tRNA-uridine aminocarboxypropyltransferase [Treponemataceae bacterium]|nr:tRNA-uridine aminocarboxypropyltransferase [Treponemataceae bacterium]